MDPLIHSITTTVAQDVRELVRAPMLDAPVLLEKDPPNFRWRVPVGFATLAAAGVLLVAAGGVQTQLQEGRRQGSPKPRKTKMHKKKLRPQPALPRR
jgi:hypothetical protein